MYELVGVMEMQMAPRLESMMVVVMVARLVVVLVEERELYEAE